MHLRRFSMLTLAGIALCVASCGGQAKIENTTPQVALTEVSGKLTVNGKPTAGVQVTGSPVNTEIGGGMVGRGETDGEGNFTLVSLDAKKGLPAGDYVLTFTFGTYSMVQRKIVDDKFNGAYTDFNLNSGKPEFKFLVTQGQSTTIPPVDLQMEETAAPN